MYVLKHNAKNSNKKYLATPDERETMLLTCFIYSIIEFNTLLNKMMYLHYLQDPLHHFHKKSSV